MSVAVHWVCVWHGGVEAIKVVTNEIISAQNFPACPKTAAEDGVIIVDASVNTERKFRPSLMK